QSCFATIKGELYVAGGWGNGTTLSVNEAYSPKTKSWTTLASMPDAVLTPGSATLGGRLYCFGGASDVQLSTVYDYVQIYQP
ncbi:MAG: kelch repeat-containing protein, partial [Terriglobales bacterium]